MTTAFVEVSVDLASFDTVDLITELNERGLQVAEDDVEYLREQEIQYDNLCEELEKIYMLREKGLDYQVELNAIFNRYLGL